MLSKKWTDHEQVRTQLRDGVGAVLAGIKERPSMAASIVRYTASAQFLVLLATAGPYLPHQTTRYFEMVAHSAVACSLMMTILLASMGMFRDFAAPPGGLQLADKLTILRFLLVAPLVFLLVDQKLWAALAVYVLCVMTDAVDGTAARRRGQTTYFGTVMDPLADIVSTAGVFGALLAIGLVPEWVIVVLCIRYGILVVGVAVLSMLVAPMRLQATRVGKIVGVLQAVIAIIIIMLAATGQSWQEMTVDVLFPLLGIIFSSVIVSQIVIGIRHLKQAR